MNKMVLQKILLQQTELAAFFCPRYASERNSESLLLFLFHRTEFRVGFSSAEWFGTEFRDFASILVPWYRIPSFLQPLWNNSERNSESFLFRGTAGIPPEQTNCSV
jgi:hypothetical protein